MAYRLDSPRQAWSRIGRRRTRTPNGSHMGGGRTRMAGGSKAKTTTRTGSGSVPITPTRDIDRRDIVEKRPSRRTLRRPQPSMMGPGRQTIHLRGGPARTVRATSLRHGPRQQRRGAHPPTPPPLPPKPPTPPPVPIRAASPARASLDPPPPPPAPPPPCGPRPVHFPSCPMPYPPMHLPPPYQVMPPSPLMHSLPSIGHIGPMMPPMGPAVCPRVRPCGCTWVTWGLFMGPPMGPQLVRQWCLQICPHQTSLMARSG